MKIYIVFTVLLVALVSEHESLKVHHSDTNSVPGNIQQQGVYQATASGTVTNGNVGVANTGSVAAEAQNYNSYQQQGNYGNPGQDSTRNYYQYTNANQPQAAQAQAQPQYYYNHYYPQQNAQYALGKLSNIGQGFGLGGQEFDEQNDGILGMLTSSFTDLLGMFGMGNSDEGHSGGYGASQSGGGWGWPQGMSMDNAGGGIGGGLGGGLGGLVLGKKAGWLKSLILAPVLLPLIALGIALIVLIILYIPIPVITPDFGRGRTSKKIWSPVERTVDLARSVLQSDQCVERVSCEIARLARSYVPDEWVDRKLESYNNKWLHRISRSVKTARSNSSCSQYSCSTFTFPLQKIRSFLTPSKAGKVSREDGTASARTSKKQ